MSAASHETGPLYYQNLVTNGYTIFANYKTAKHDVFMRVRPLSSGEFMNRYVYKDLEAVWYTKERGVFHKETWSRDVLKSKLDATIKDSQVMRMGYSPKPTSDEKQVAMHLGDVHWNYEISNAK